MPKKSARLDYMPVVCRINRFLGSIDHLDNLLSLIMEEAGKAVNAEASSIALYDPKKKELLFTIALGKKGGLIKQTRMKLGQGILGWAAQKKKPLNIPDVAKDRRFHADLDKKTAFKSKSILAVPMLHQKKLVGAIEVINKIGGKCFSRQDQELLEVIAGQAAITIENAMLYRKLALKHKALMEKHRQLIEAQNKLIFMERLGTIGKMASGIIHDFRNPLTSIRCFAELLCEPALAEKDRQEFSKTITSEVDRLTDMSNELLEFARGESKLSFTEYPLGHFIDETCAFIKRDMQNNNINVITELNYTGPICMDTGKMQRVILNLASNAKDVMAGGGTFKIETDLQDNKARIRVSDTGSGISKEIADKLFEPFVTYGKAHGTGLGLAIVKKVVENHKGRITAESPGPKPGSFSTTFIITLPLQQ